MGKKQKIKNFKTMTPDEAKADFKENLKDKDMSPLLEYYYSLVGFNTFDDSNVDDVLKYYSKIKNNADPSVTETIYATSNESVRNIFIRVNVDGKRVATVGSSGDQALHAICYGASEVDLIDANILTRALVELKIAAIKVLDVDHFDYFISNIDRITKDIRINKYYQKISHLLPKDIQVFWDTIIMDGGESENFSFSSMFYTTQADVFLNSALQIEDMYNDIQQKLRNGDYKLNYIVADIADFPKELKGKYDLILLSNVVDYCNYKTFTNTVEQLYANNLNIGGYMQLTSTRILNNELEELINELGARKQVMSNSGIMFAPSLMLEKTREYQPDKVLGV